MAGLHYKTIAIIVAGGKGLRFGGDVAKQFVPLAGKALLLRTLEAFEDCDVIDAICLVVPAGSEQPAAGWQEGGALTKLQWVIGGGEERQYSTRKGLKELPPCEIVLVHDGARPLVSGQLIARVVAGAEEKGACVPGLRVQETLKKIARAGHVITTVNRDNYATIQTPQGFRYPLLMEAFKEAEADHFIGTDEAMLVERMGFPVCLVEGAAENLKVTTLKDLKWAEAWLQGGAA